MNRLEKIIKIFKKFKTNGATADANYHIKSVKKLAKYLTKIGKNNFEDTERKLHGLIYAIDSYAFRLNCDKEDVEEYDSEFNLTSDEIENEIQDCEKKISKCEKKISKCETRIQRSYRKVRRN